MSSKGSCRNRVETAQRTGPAGGRAEESNSAGIVRDYCHEPMGNRVEGYGLKFMCLGAKLTRGGVVMVKLDKT